MYYTQSILQKLLVVIAVLSMQDLSCAARQQKAPGMEQLTDGEVSSLGHSDFIEDKGVAAPGKAVSPDLVTLPALAPYGAAARSSASINFVEYPFPERFSAMPCIKDASSEPRGAGAAFMYQGMHKKKLLAGHSRKHHAVRTEVKFAPADEFYTEKQLKTLRSFSSALFQTTRESLFPQLPPEGAPNLKDDYFSKMLGAGSPMRGCLLKPDTIKKEMAKYLTTFKEEDNATLEASWSASEKNDEFLDALKTVSATEKGILSSELKSCRYVKKSILRDEKEAPQLVFYIGDIHGGVHSLLRSLMVLFEYGYLNDDFTLADNVHLVFLGDYTDRGLRGIETIYTILRLKNATWDNVHLVRGNHEDAKQTARYGFATELRAKYGDLVGNDLHDACLNFYATLPVATFFGFYDDTDDKMLFSLGCHGCMSPYFSAKEFLADGDIVCALLSDEMVGSFAQSRLFEWSDVTGNAMYEKMHKASAALTDFVPEGGRGVKLHYRDLGKILAINDVMFVVRGHQDSHAPVKVCCEGEDAPISFRGHPRFQAAGITPYNLFYQGIRLVDAPSCITTTTCVEAKVMPTEGLVWIQHGTDIGHSRWGGLDVNLTSLSLAELGKMVQVSHINAVPPIEVPCALIGQAAAEAMKNRLYSICDTMNAWTGPGSPYSFASSLWQGIVQRFQAFVSTGSFVVAQGVDGDLHTPAFWDPARSMFVHLGVYHREGGHFKGLPLAVDLGDLRASFDRESVLAADGAADLGDQSAVVGTDMDLGEG